MRKAIRYFIVIMLTGIIMFPLIWMLFSSFKEQSEFIESATRIFPKKFSLAAYKKVVDSVPLIRWFLNSVLISVAETAIRVGSSILAGYVFVRYDFKLKKILFGFILLTIAIPPQIMIIPMFLFVAELGLINNYLGVILPMAVSGYAIFYMKQSFEDIPKSFAESATVDGANELQILWNIYIPVTKPAISALIIIMMITSWNSFQWPLLIMQKEKLYPITVAINYFVGETSINWSATLAVAIVTALPVIVVYLVFQKKFVSSFINSGIKG